MTIEASAADSDKLFISYAGPDAAWAEWVAWQLQKVGYAVELDRWDWAAGDNWVVRMTEALQRCDRVVALFSEAYFEHQRFTKDEWTAVLARRDRDGHLVPLRLEEVSLPDILRPLIAPRLVGLAEEDARRVLIDAVRGPQRPEQEPAYPGKRPPSPQPDVEAPRLPGSHQLTLWEVPHRNGAFIGRDRDIDHVRQRLRPGQPVVIQSELSLGGVGKTQIATEYVHRYAAQYDLIAWINAEEPQLVPAQLTALAAGLGLVTEHGEAGALPALRAHLQQRARWLLVFDNAETVDAVQPSWLPPGAGHVLITSRSWDWPEFAPVRLDLFMRRESVTLLQTRVKDLSDEVADRVADKLGDLPLALVQAATVLAGMPADIYLELLDSNAAEVLDQGLPPSYPRSLAAALRMSINALGEDREALHLLRLCCVLAPEPIPMTMLCAAPDAIPPLESVLTSQVRLHQTAARLGELAFVTQRGIQVHRLVQTLVVSQLSAPQRDELRRQGSALVAASRPGDPASAATWPAWSQLMPHLLTVDPGASDDVAVRVAACDALLYLLYSGNTTGGFRLAERLYGQWLQKLGADDPHTLTAAAELAHAYHNMGRDREALHLVEETLARRRETLDSDESATLRSASDRAIVLASLGKLTLALQQAEDVLARRIVVLGADHRDTLTTRSVLAGWRGEAGDHTAAITGYEQVLTDQLRVLGPDHPHTLITRNSLARWRGEAGDHTAAITGYEQVLTDQLRVLGPDHPDTLTTRGNLAGWRGEAGDHTAAITGYERVLTDQLRVLGPEHPDTLNTRGNLARWRGAAGNHTAAITGFEQLLTDQLRVLGPDHPDTLNTRSHLARWRGEAGNHTAAITGYEQVLTDQLRVLGPDHPNTLAVRSNLARVRGQAGDHTAAITGFEQLLTDQLRVLGPDHPDTLNTRSHLTGWRGAAGNHTAAITGFEQLLTDQLRVLGPDHPDTLITRGNLAALLLRRNAVVPARAHAAEKLRLETRLFGRNDRRTRETSDLLDRIRTRMGGTAHSSNERTKKKKGRRK